MLGSIVLVVMASSVGNIAVPYVFSRLIDSLTLPELAGAIVLMFGGYALLRGGSTALAYAVFLAQDWTIGLRACWV